MSFLCINLYRYSPQLSRYLNGSSSLFPSCSSSFLLNQNRNQILKRRMCTTLKNEGSTCRDHLANERTFLAYARTGLSFLGAGTGLFTAYSFAYTERSLEEGLTSKEELLSNGNIHPSEIVPACGLLILNGAFVLGFAIHRYLHVQEALKGGNFVIASKGIKGLVGTTVVSTLASLSIIYSKEMENKPRSHKKQKEKKGKDVTKVKGKE